MRQTAEKSDSRAASHHVETAAVMALFVDCTVDTAAAAAITGDQDGLTALAA